MSWCCFVMPDNPPARPDMHVCLVCGSYPPVRCGVGDYTACLARALAQAGARVSILTSAGISPTPSHPQVTVVPEVHSWSLAGLPALGRVLARLQPEVVHLQYPSLGYGFGLGPNALLSWLAWRLPSTFRFLTLHEYAMFSWRGKLRIWPALAAAQGVFFTNHRDRRAARGFGELGLQRRLVVPLGSPVAGDDPSPELRPFSQDRRTWVHFGSVMPNKGWEVLLPALQGLRQANPAWRLDVVGDLLPGQYAYHARIQAGIRNLGLEEAVSFLGYLPPERVRAVFQNSSGLAVLPFNGGAQLNRSSLVAALQAGLAVVATRPPAVLEGLRHGENIWLVEPNQPGALAEGMRTLQADPELAHRLQTGARNLARRFAWSRIARRVLAVYDGE